MTEYGKTENLFARDAETHRLTRELRLPEFGQIREWLVTEKIDGTNIRLVLEWETDDKPVFDVRGRTDNATLPKNFVQEAVPFDYARMVEAWRSIDPGENSSKMVVYGEGYGPGIQKGGGNYADRKSLAIFDVITWKGYDYELNAEDWDAGRPASRRYGRGLWHTWDDVKTVARVLDLPTVPLLYPYDATLDEIIALTEGGFLSAFRSRAADVAGRTVEAEGIVARTDPYLFNFRGERVMFKLKTKDLAPA